MKKVILIVTAAFFLSACTEYLDVKPRSQVDKDVLFETASGFEEALIGVYARGSEEDIYGDELTFGFLDVLAQNYTVMDQKEGNVFEAEKYMYQQTQGFNYRDRYFILRRNAAWSGLYNTISNCNLILDHLEEKKTIFPEQHTYQLIKGEALAMRAYLHFDLLRLFAPSYQNNPVAPAIPYVTKFSNEVSPQLTVTEVLDRIVADLLAAKALLAEADPINRPDYVVGYNTEEKNPRIFLHNRRNRMNYFAAAGTLARVYLYRGDHPKALASALEVIDAQKFPWTDKLDFTVDDPEQKDRVLYKELLFGWYLSNNRSGRLADRFKNKPFSTTLSVGEGNSIYETGGVGGDDLRFKQWLIEANDGISAKLQLRKYDRTQNNRHYLMAPALKLSEMYYIAAEASFDTDPEKAWNYFNTVRFQRGVGAEIHNEPSKEVFLTELGKEYRKEFYGEGQLFYFYKRLHRPIVGQLNAVIPASNDKFVLPMPDDEIAFGQRK